MEDKNKKMITLLIVFTIIFTIIGSTFAYLNWQTSSGQQTSVTFTVTKEFSCSADGGNELTSSSILLEPTTCDDASSAIKREITLKPQIDTTGISIYMDMWLDVVSLDEGLKNSDNLKWVLSTSSTSCSGASVKSSGTFKGKVKDDKVLIIEGTSYATTTTDKYYLYIWLDKEETSPTTMNQNFEFKLNGECGIIEPRGSEPETPVLDNGLIPVILSDDAVNGYKVTATTSSDSDWYDYHNKKWANAVLVKENGVKTRAQNTVAGTEINPNDILGYFVWIPRYKYKIEPAKCSTINNPTMIENPSCYDVPYVMSDINKTYLINWWQNIVIEMVGLTTYTQAEATAAINEGLNTGTLTLTVGEDSVSMPMLEFLFQMYTNGYEYEISDSESLATFLYDMISAEDDTYTEELALEAIDNALHSGLILYNFEPIGTMEDMISYYNEANTTDITYTKTELISATFNGDNYLSSDNPTEIDIVFEDNSTTKSLGNAVSTYRTHPAFTFGSEELDGIWVGKFETTGSGTTPTVLPNSKQLTSQNVSTQFQTALKFTGGTLSNGTVSFSTTNSYGIGTTLESHMMKSSEWGAVAYLSHSQYGLCKNGKCEEVRINNYYSSGYKTGCGALESNASSSNVCSNAYASGMTAYPQSTTGNITGIFDMSGGVWEYTMGVFANSNGELWSGYKSDYNSGFNGLLGSSGTEYTSGIPFPTETKYYDKYQASSGTTINEETACDGGICYGHALSETAGWYEDYASLVFAGHPWFMRGGVIGDGANAGAFKFMLNGGYSYYDRGFRSVLAP